MSRISIFNTHAVKTTINAVQLQELTSFLSRYRSVVSVYDTKPLVSARQLIETPINTIYSKLYESGKDKLFGFFKVPEGTPHPEIITYQHVTFDMLQLKDVSPELFASIDFVPEFSKKIIFNVTGLTKKNNELNNVGAFQGLFVRDLLSRSFYNSKDLWLTPPHVQYLCKTYSMSIAVAISTVFGLSIFESQMVSTIFALYFLQQVSNAHDAEVILRNSVRYLIPGSQDVTDVLARLKELLGDRYEHMTFDDACECVGQLGVNRLGMVNRALIYSRMKSVGPDVNTSVIALEYPPYWAYLVLLAGSGQKIGLTDRLKKFGLQKDIPRITAELIRSPALLSSLN